MLRIIGLAGVVLFGCTRGADGERWPGDSERPEAPADGTPPGRKAEVTPEVAARAEQILRERPDAPIGAMVPFRLNGRSYVARFEEHDNAEGEPGRPPGKHKGVTVYEATK